jgi:hypothetical protein
MNGAIGAAWFETREDALLTMRVFFIPCFYGAVS